MAKIIDLIEYFKKYPVFDNTILMNRLDKSREYTNLSLYRLRKNYGVIRIEKNKYTVYKDPFLIASRIVWPSYISLWSALSYHNLTEQIPHDIWVITTRNKKNIEFIDTNIRFVKIRTKNFFGYEKIRHGNFEIFVAEAEKAIIDSALLNKISFSELRDIFLNHIGDLRIYKLLSYLKRGGNKSLIKRFGFLCESCGRDYYRVMRRYIDPTYVRLDNSKESVGKKNKKWRLIINA